MAVRVDGREVVEVDPRERKFYTWRIDQGRQTKHKYAAEKGPLFPTPDGQGYLIGLEKGTVVLWDSQQAKRIGRVATGAKNVEAIASSPGGRFIVIGDSQGRIRIADWRTGGTVLTLMGHTGPVRAFAFSADGRYMASASDDTSVFVWRFPYARLRREVTFAFRKSKARKGMKPALEDLGHPDPLRWCTAFDELAAMGDAAVPALQEAYPPEQSDVSGDPQGLLEALDDPGFEVRLDARKRLARAWPQQRLWVQRKLAEPAKLSLDARVALEKLWQNADPAYMNAERGRTRAVLLLLEMPPSKAVLEALGRYARGPASSYAAERARLRLSAQAKAPKKSTPERSE